MASRRPTRPARPTPEPLEVDAVAVVTVGTVAWGVAGLALLAFGQGWLAAHDRTWWLWTCATGFVLGLAGIGYVRHRRDRLARAVDPGYPTTESPLPTEDAVRGRVNGPEARTGVRPASERPRRGRPWRRVRRRSR